VSLLTLCELAEGVGIETQERRIALYDLLNADATFMTATSCSVLPVTRWTVSRWTRTRTCTRR
jgi:branched-subunit amino acid aminotransferase/4-amino-4-deoxychorismate lyase